MDDKCPVKEITVKFFILVSGNEPVKDWLRLLSSEDKKIIGEDVKTVEFGWPLGMPLVRKLNRDLWEVRSDLDGRRIARVLFTVKGRNMVLLHFFYQKVTENTKKRFSFG